MDDGRNDDEEEDDKVIDNTNTTVEPGRLEELKQREAELSALLAAVRREKLSALQSRPLTIGVIGFGRFGQFISRAFAKYGRVIVSSRSDYSDVAAEMGVTYVPLAEPERFLEYDLDVIVLGVSILSFRSTVQDLVPYLEEDIERRRKVADAHVMGPL